MSATAPPPFRRMVNAPWASDAPMRHRPTVTRPQRPHVIPIPPVRLFGSRGPLITGVMSDAAAAVRKLWLPADH